MPDLISLCIVYPKIPKSPTSQFSPLIIVAEATIPKTSIAASFNIPILQQSQLIKTCTIAPVLLFCTRRSSLELFIDSLSKIEKIPLRLGSPSCKVLSEHLLKATINSMCQSTILGMKTRAPRIAPQRLASGRPPQPSHTYVTHVSWLDGPHAVHARATTATGVTTGMVTKRVICPVLRPLLGVAKEVAMELARAFIMRLARRLVRRRAIRLDIVQAVRQA